MIAEKTDPALWREAKRAACAQAGLCAHSARKMQWATRHYKRHGGGYKGRRSPRTNRLSKWSRERWRTRDGRPSAGVRRYLPDAAWRRLSPAQVRRTDAAKRRATRRGRQYSAQPADVVRAVRGTR